MNRFDLARAAVLAAWLASGPAVAGDDLSPREQRARDYLTDAVVQAHDGREGRFFSDFLRGKVVLINLFYAGCKQACPLTNAKLAEVQDLLGGELGRRYLLLSITIDPGTDDLATMRRLAGDFGARPGWLFVTGPAAEVARLTARLGNVVPDKEAHRALFLAGNPSAGRWVKIPPNAPAAAIAERLRLLLDVPG